MTRISDLPGEMVEEILSRVPLTSLRSVRSTCKTWNDFSKNHIVGGKAAARNQLVGFMLVNNKLFSLNFDLQGIGNGSHLADPCMKRLSMFGQVEISEVFHCDGLMLIHTKEKKHVVWNPYTGKTRWIQPKNDLRFGNMYALGYKKSKNNNHNHKILTFLQSSGKGDPKNAIYEFSSNSWRVLCVNTYWDIRYYCQSLKGNAYFVAREKIPTVQDEFFLVCFDFTTERFGPRLALPCDQFSYIIMPFSCVRDEQLAVISQQDEPVEMMKIWITTKIEPKTVSWSNFLKVAITQLNGFPDDDFVVWSFFIDEEKKVAGVFEADGLVPTLYIIGPDGYFKSINITSVDFGEARKRINRRWEIECSSYVPSLVQLEINQ